MKDDTVEQVLKATLRCYKKYSITQEKLHGIQLSDKRRGPNMDNTIIHMQRERENERASSSTSTR